MLQKTRGIILSNIKYGDSGIITSVYTELFGRMSFITQGIRSKKSLVRSSYFQPLFLVEIELYYKPGRDLQRIREIKNSAPFSSLPFEINKSTQALFIAEFLNKILREEEPQPALFEFLFNSIRLLDLMETGIANFHLVFLVQLSRFLGFGPTNNFSDSQPYYDLMAGVFVTSIPMHPHYLTREESVVFSKLLSMTYQDLPLLSIEKQIRKVLPERILEYFNLHTGTNLNIKSLDIIREILY
jgi:DNA repair protein RecO (recombination protein O)